MDAHEVELFYDGECPLCMREVSMLRRLDRRQRILFRDIAAPDFDARAYGRDHATFMAQIHARLPSGEWLTGVEVFRRLYGAVGFGPVVALTRLPGVRGLLDVGYDWFARNRLRLTGRCEADVCTPPGVAPGDDAAHFSGGTP